MACQIQEIDGSVLEGGGQILRIALTLSAVKRIPVRITKIRAGRSKPGLMEQHLKGIELTRDLCNGRLKGAQLGATEVELWPGEMTGGRHEARVRTAGSISLLLQVALPCALFAKTESILHLHGGTNAEMAPQVDYTTEVFRPILEKFGATFDFDLRRRGYFPKGGGEVVVTVQPVAQLKPVNLVERGDITKLYGWSFVAGTFSERLAQAMADAASGELRWVVPNIKIESYKEDRNLAPDNCTGVILVAETSTGCILGGSALGKRNEHAEEAGKRAAQDLLKSLDEGACVDGHSQDQIIVLMALASGPSKVRVGEITMHTKTAIFVTEKMTNVKFEIIPDGSTNIIECTGSQPQGDIKDRSQKLRTDVQWGSAVSSNGLHQKRDSSHITPPQEQLAKKNKLTTTVPDMEVVNTASVPVEGRTAAGPGTNYSSATKITRVAVLSKKHPAEILSTKQLSILEDAIVEEMTIGWEHKLQFEGIQFKPGMLIVECANSQTATWLQEKANKLGHWKGVELRAYQGDDIPMACEVTIFFPRSTGQDTKKILSLVQNQNEGLNTQAWKVLTAKEEGQGQVCKIAIDDLSFGTIRKNGDTIRYRFGKIPVHGLVDRKEARKEREEEHHPPNRNRQ